MRRFVLAACLAAAAGTLAAQRGGGGQFPGGTNPDGSLRPSRPVTAFFSQDA